MYIRMHNLCMHDALSACVVIIIYYVNRHIQYTCSSYYMPICICTFMYIHNVCMHDVLSAYVVMLNRHQMLSACA